ncbi:PPR domain-containing protein/PPR_2 domain-containing protein/PPR_3 domain-containing protein [Gossypium australe]|uniref:PPR domain-containing protein/PPR_2 domain-containing protein/PPR_3 domain-containing protein n=1 Tax=Gossypium australe TaxID=47621 RepID=A0A5B6VVQ7_9ROSI|nr:PPR domain-containing protein/PPR_2 domain-containing protein/PPR_3 domain-containing protein [Gossypium australe]
MGCKVSSELAVEVFSWVLKDWEVLFTLFLLAGKQPDYAQSSREHHSMISIIGKMRKLDTASALVDEMREKRIGMFTMRNKEEVFELFEKMKQMGCQPINDTYIMMIESLVNGATSIMSSGKKMVDFKSNQLQNNQLDNQIRVETK